MLPLFLLGVNVSTKNDLDNPYSLLYWESLEIMGKKIGLLIASVKQELQRLGSLLPHQLYKLL